VKLIYTPEGGTPQEWRFEPDEFTSLEAETIEEAGGNQWATFGDWIGKVYGGGWRAMRVFLWLMLSRANPELGLNEVQPKVKEITLDLEEPAKPGKDESGDVSTDSESPNVA
jgi:hypothetical protein